MARPLNRDEGNKLKKLYDETAKAQGDKILLHTPPVAKAPLMFVGERPGKTTQKEEPNQVAAPNGEGENQILGSCHQYFFNMIGVICRVGLIDDLRSIQSTDASFFIDPKNDYHTDGDRRIRHSNTWLPKMVDILSPSIIVYVGNKAAIISQRAYLQLAFRQRLPEGIKSPTIGARLDLFETPGFVFPHFVRRASKIGREFERDVMSKSVTGLAKLIADHAPGTPYPRSM